MHPFTILGPSHQRRPHPHRHGYDDTLSQLLSETLPTRAKTLQPIKKNGIKLDISQKHEIRHEMPQRHDIHTQQKHDTSQHKLDSKHNHKDYKQDEKHTLVSTIPSRRKMSNIQHTVLSIPDTSTTTTSPTHGRRSIFNHLSPTSSSSTSSQSTTHLSPSQPSTSTHLSPQSHTSTHLSPSQPHTSRRNSRITSGRKRTSTTNHESPKKPKNDETSPSSSSTSTSPTTSAFTFTSPSTSTSTSTSLGLTLPSTSSSTPRFPLAKLDLSSAQSFRSPYTRRDARRINGTEEDGLDEKKIEDIVEKEEEMEIDSVDPLSGSHFGLLLDVGMYDDPNPAYRPTMEDAHVIKIGLAQTMRSPSAAPAPRSPPRQRRPTTLSALPPSSSALPANLGGFFAIYDGHGGRDCVDFIAHQLHRDVMRRVRTCTDVTSAIEQAFLATDGMMAKQSKFQDCGSTAQIIFIRTNNDGTRTLYAANVGDAQAYLAVDRHSRITTSMPNMTSLLPSSFTSTSSVSQSTSTPTSRYDAMSLSYPHVATDTREIARIKSCGGRVFMGRVNGSLAVSRAFGDYSLKRAGVSAQPYQMNIPLQSQHKFVIIGCDGIWDVMSGQEAIDAVSHMSSAQDMAKHLVNLALEKGTTDNVSCMVIRLHE